MYTAGTPEWAGSWQTLIEVVVKPILVRFGKKGLSLLDDHVDVVPDFLHQEPFDR